MLSFYLQVKRTTKVAQNTKYFILKLYFTVSYAHLFFTTESGPLSAVSVIAELSALRHHSTNYSIINLLSLFILVIGSQLGLVYSKTGNGAHRRVDPGR